MSDKPCLKTRDAETWVERLTRERDEARAEIAVLNVQVQMLKILANQESQVRVRAVAEAAEDLQEIVDECTDAANRGQLYDKDAKVMRAREQRLRETLAAWRVLVPRG